MSSEFFFSLYHKRNDFSPSVKEILKKYGNNRITHIVVCRHPLNSILNYAATFFSSSQQYDKYFHLFMILTLSNGVKLQIEKESVIKITDKLPKPDRFDEFFYININHYPTLNDFLNNSRIKQRDFFHYKANSNNCQEFVLNLLRDNGFNSNEAQGFILQNVKDIFENNTLLRQFVNSITDLAARADVIRQGGNIKKPSARSERFS